MMRLSVRTTTFEGPSFRVNIPPYFLAHSVNLGECVSLGNQPFSIWCIHLLEIHFLLGELVQVANNRQCRRT